MPGRVCHRLTAARSWPPREFQSKTQLVVRTERSDKPLDRVPLGKRSIALQVLDAAGAQPRPFGQLLLGKAS
jgi:hypothetical protein